MENVDFVKPGDIECVSLMLHLAFKKKTTVDWSVIGDRKEPDVLGSHLSPYCYPFVIENIMNGKLKTDGIVSHVFHIEEWEKAFEYAAGGHSDFKVAIKF